MILQVQYNRVYDLILGTRSTLVHARKRPRAFAIVRRTQQPVRSTSYPQYIYIKIVKDVDRNRRSGARTKRRHLHARRARAESFQRPYRYYRVTLGGRVTPSPAPRRLTACVIAGCVGHASGSIAIAAPVLGGPESVRIVCFTAAASFRGPCMRIPAVPASIRAANEKFKLSTS